MSESKNVIVLISGGGRTLENLLKHRSDAYKIAGVIASKDCNGLKHAEAAKLPYSVLNFRGESISTELKKCCVNWNADLIVLAGFIQKYPADLLKEWPVLNIHPALLPKYGGKGMYGLNVHKAVKEAGEKESGATVHLVTENYDEGPILAQSKVELESSDTAAEIAAKVFAVECELYPRAIEAYVRGDLPSAEVLKI